MLSLHLDKVDIYSWQKTKTNGITSKEPIIKYKDVRCTLSQKNVSNLTNEPLTRSEVRYTLFIPEEIDVKAGDKLVVTTRGLTFRAQTPFRYPFLRKQEVELETWAE